jgi:hypothetical protein
MPQLTLKNGVVLLLENYPPQIIIIYPNENLAKESYHHMLKSYEKLQLITRIED